MFFLPLISVLRQMNIAFRLLCLTTGDYDGLGKVRMKEIAKVSSSLKALSIEVVDDMQLKDGPILWDPNAVKQTVENYLAKHLQIGAIFTFDNYGVSGHPNHISVYRGIKLISSIPRYSLESVPIWRKYLPVLDFIMTLALSDERSLVALNLDDPGLSLSTMKLYASQNVWFRKLFSIFSRYSYINTFQPIE
jgi:N-acetylglucosaminylphosphatidylinositol deacetylase